MSVWESGYPRLASIPSEFNQRYSYGPGATLRELAIGLQGTNVCACVIWPMGLSTTVPRTVYIDVRHVVYTLQVLLWYVYVNNRDYVDPLTKLC